VIIKGRARIIDDMEEKFFALKCLMEKHVNLPRIDGHIEVLL